MGNIWWVDQDDNTSAYYWLISNPLNLGNKTLGVQKEPPTPPMDNSLWKVHNPV